MERRNLMTITKEKMTETVLSGAAEMAEKLHMQQTEIPDCWADRPILIVTPKGISIGVLKVDHGEMRTYRYVNFTLNGELIFTEKYAITEQGWAKNATTEIHLDDNAIVYGGYGTL
jgi:hypothetical protein